MTIISIHRRVTTDGSIEWEFLSSDDNPRRVVYRALPPMPPNVADMLVIRDFIKLYGANGLPADLRPPAWEKPWDNREFRGIRECYHV